VFEQLKKDKLLHVQPFLDFLFCKSNIFVEIFGTTDLLLQELFMAQIFVEIPIVREKNKNASGLPQEGVRLIVVVSSKVNP
jgi:hypothetical protein